MVSKIDVFSWLAVLGVIFCAEAKSIEPRTLRVQLSSEPVSLESSLAEDGGAIRVLGAMMSGLVRYDRDERIKYELAQKMEVTHRGTRYRFHLRSWRWSDSKPVTADDFIVAFKRTLDPSTPAKLAPYLFVIKNAKAFKNGTLRDFSQVGVKALKKDLLEFELERPAAFFPKILALPIGYPQRADQSDASTGPYVLQSWARGQRIELRQNERYPFFDKSAPKLVVFQVLPEEASAVQLFEANKLDVLTRVSAYELERFRKKGWVKTFPYFSTYYIGFNQRVAPWQNLAARLAVASAIDRKGIVKALGTGEAPATSFIPGGINGARTDLGSPFNVASAKKFWAQVYEPVDTLELGFDSGHRNQLVAEKIQSDIKLNLGLSIRLQQHEWKTYVGQLATSPPSMFRFGWLSPFADAYASLSLFESTNPNNYTGWKNSAFDALLEKIAALESNNPSRQKLIDQAHRLLLDNAVVVPIYHYNQSLVVSPRIEGLWVSGMGVFDLMRVRFKEIP